MLVGIVGKPSCGKSTFLNALTMVNAKVGDYPFTTVDPNRGTAYVQSTCVCKELEVQDNPKNSICTDGIRYLPIQILDVAGLVPGASEGRGLGNKFLDDLRQADVLIHVVDASGSLDAEGNKINKGSWDPLKDVSFLEEEIDAWIKSIIMRDYEVMRKKAAAEKLRFSILLHEKLTGLAIKKHHIDASIREVGIVDNDVNTWDENLDTLITTIRRKSKPIVVVANKIDQPTSADNFSRMQNELDAKVFPVSALAEVFLRTEHEDKTISYKQGEAEFTMIDEEKLGDSKKQLLTKIQSDLLEKYGSTGVHDVLTNVVFDLLNMIVVYPVEDVSKFSDKSGNVLPDAYLVPKGTTAIELAGKVHSDFAENFIHGSLAPSGRRVGTDYELRNNEVIKIVSAVK
ncbi:MAG: redox-regulated ATPase YchF [Candidatus Heimdallarchaeota archaeon]|nr:redox-regulated ATPase YchF [Candidatus Heimdallarchaeota archaeon]